MEERGIFLTVEQRAVEDGSAQGRVSSPPSLLFSLSGLSLVQVGTPPSLKQRR